MRIAQEITLISRGNFSTSQEWHDIRDSILDAVRKAEWPVGRGEFFINPVKKGNGVVPIKGKPMELLNKAGWSLELPWAVTEAILKPAPEGKKGTKGSKPGKIDAAKILDQGRVVVEWETGNISSSHRSINKMALGLIQKSCIAGILIVPNYKLARYLTDRIGNIEELSPYFRLWESIAVTEGILELIVIEHDGEDASIPLIPKGQDGRAKEGAARLNKG